MATSDTCACGTGGSVALGDPRTRKNQMRPQLALYSVQDDAAPAVQLQLLRRSTCEDRAPPRHATPEPRRAVFFPSPRANVHGSACRKARVAGRRLRRRKEMAFVYVRGRRLVGDRGPARGKRHRQSQWRWDVRVRSLQKKKREGSTQKREIICLLRT